MALVKLFWRFRLLAPQISNFLLIIRIGPLEPHTLSTKPASVLRKAVGHWAFVKRSVGREGMPVVALRNRCVKESLTRKGIPECCVLCGCEIDAHQRACRVRRVEQSAWRKEIALIKHSLRKSICVHARIHPTEQAPRLRGEVTPSCQSQSYAARSRSIQASPDSLGVTAQLALLNANGDGLFHQGWRRQGAEEFRVDHALDKILRSRQETHSPIGCQNFGESAHVDGAAQTIQST